MPGTNLKTYNRFTFGHTRAKSGSKSQIAMLDILKGLLPGMQVLTNYRLPLLDTERKQYPITGSYWRLYWISMSTLQQPIGCCSVDMEIQYNLSLYCLFRRYNVSQKTLKFYEFDVSFLNSFLIVTHKVFLPQLSLALEYQGETHYFSSHIFGKASDRQQIDQIKHNFASHIGISVISVPFWWDKSPNSLAATILLYRPDINFQNMSSALPIPEDLPLKYQNKFSYVPNAARDFKGQVDPTGW
jgi:hypothetical protein